MTLPLVVGVDGSEGSLLAVDWAADEAARHGLPLRLVHASSGERYEGAPPGTGRERPSEQAVAERILACAGERARRRSPGLEVSAGTVPEEAVSALLRAGSDAFALVTGSRGRGELKGALLGSVGPAVAARASCPVVVVRGDRAGLAGTHERILLGVKDPGTSGEAVRFAFREAEVRGCELDVVRARRSPAHGGADRPAPAADPAHRHEEQASALVDALVAEASAAHPAVRVRRATVEGPARKVLVHRSAAADLVVVGARHRPGPFGLRLGRVSHALLHHAACPVAVVPQTA